MRASPVDRRLLVQADSLPVCVTSPEKIGISNRRQWYLVDASAALACSQSITPADLPAPASDD